MGKNALHLDWVVIVPLVCLGLFSLFVLLSVDRSLVYGQLSYLILGFILMRLVSLLHPLFLVWFAPIGYFMANAFILVTFLSPHVRGATRWLSIGSLRMQPSELVKPMYLLFFAWMITRFPPRNLKYLPLHLFLISIPVLLIFRQPDLGSSLIYLISWTAMVIAGGLPILAAVLFSGAVALGFPFLWNILAGYQKSRIMSFLFPMVDPKGAGYNALQAMIAVGSGQLFGRGLGRGTQSHLRFLPEHHTDFIYAALVEELGFIGGLILIFCYVVLLWRIVSPLIRLKSVSAVFYVYTVGLFSMILAQVFINIGMNMGLVPITGITLPFVSYGGSSLLSLSMALGIYWSLIRLDD